MPGPVLSRSNLLACCADLFVAGSETTSKTMLWAVAYLVHQPAVQARARAEVRAVAAGRSLLTWQDRQSLPFTRAVLEEVWRCGNVLPLFVRSNTEPVQCGQTEIPPGTVIIGNTYSVHMDPTYWADPGIFRPERFMAGDSFRPDERNIPFGLVVCCF